MSDPATRLKSPAGKEKSFADVAMADLQIQGKKNESSREARTRVNKTSPKQRGAAQIQ
jgi:hypothetical protein